MANTRSKGSTVDSEGLESGSAGSKNLSYESSVRILAEAGVDSSISDTGSVISSVATVSAYLSTQLRNAPSAELLTSWMQLVVKGADFSEEGIVDVTQDLFDLYPEEFVEKIEALPKSERLLVESIISGEPAYYDSGIDTSILPAPSVSQKLVAEFVAERVVTRGRGPTYQGTLTIFGEDESPVGRYVINSGRVGRSYKHYGGPIPPGLYSITDYASPVSGDAYSRHGLSYWFRLTRRPGTNVFGRSGFGIHPDGNVFGTLGCLGVYEDAAGTRNCQKQLRNALDQGFSRLVRVDYSLLSSSLTQDVNEIGLDSSQDFDDGSFDADAGDIDELTIDFLDGPGGPLGELISRGEGGYDSFNRGRAGDSRNKRIDFSKLTIAEIMRAQSLPRRHPERLFAIGKYQVIPLTMRGAVEKLRLDLRSRLTHRLQEMIFRNYLISLKRPSVRRFIVGGGSLSEAQFALAYEFASVARPDTGRSHYGGSGGNVASISAREVAQALRAERDMYRRFVNEGISSDRAWNRLSSGID